MFYGFILSMLYGGSRGGDIAISSNAKLATQWRVRPMKEIAQPSVPLVKFRCAQSTQEV